MEFEIDVEVVALHLAIHSQVCFMLRTRHLVHAGAYRLDIINKQLHGDAETIARCWSRGCNVSNNTVKITCSWHIENIYKNCTLHK